MDWIQFSNNKFDNCTGWICSGSFRWAWRVSCSCWSKSWYPWNWRHCQPRDRGVCYYWRLVTSSFMPMFWCLLMANQVVVVIGQRQVLARSTKLFMLMNFSFRVGLQIIGYLLPLWCFCIKYVAFAKMIYFQIEFWKMSVWTICNCIKYVARQAPGWGGSVTYSSYALV